MWRPLKLIENTCLTSPRPYHLLFLLSILTAPHVVLCASAPLRFSVLFASRFTTCLAILRIDNTFLPLLRPYRLLFLPSILTAPHILLCASAFFRLPSLAFWVKEFAASPLLVPLTTGASATV